MYGQVDSADAVNSGPGVRWGKARASSMGRRVRQFERALWLFPDLVELFAQGSNHLCSRSRTVATGPRTKPKNRPASVPGMAALDWRSYRILRAAFNSLRGASPITKRVGPVSPLNHTTDILCLALRAYFYPRRRRAYADFWSYNCAWLSLLRYRNRFLDVFSMAIPFSQRNINDLSN